MARKPRGVSYRREFIEAIQTIFPPQWFSQFSSHGNCVWTPQRVLWMSIVMSWQPHPTLRGQFQAARDLLRQLFPRWKLGRSPAGFLAARQRLLPQMQQPLQLRLQLAVAAYFEAWRVRGWLLFAVDGSRFESPRTTPNEQQLGCAGKASTTPQVFQTTLQHVGSGLPWDFRLGPGTDSERRHLDAMLPTLPPQAMLTADAGFISFALCHALLSQGHSLLLRVGANVRLLTKLGWTAEMRGRTVYLWPESQRHLPPVVLRLIVIRKDGRQPVYLVTNVFEVEQLSDADAAELYRLRWEIELYYRSCKQTLGHHTLLSRTPSLALAEQTWHVFATWGLQLLTVQSLIAARRPPLNWSAARARDAIHQTFSRALSDEFGPAAGTLRRRLQQAHLDDYRRHGAKQIRDTPRKKQDRPPRPPKLRPAGKKELKQLQRLRTKTSPES